MSSHRVLFTVVLGCLVAMGGCGDSTVAPGGTGGSGATGGNRGPGETGGTGGSGDTGGTGGSGATGGMAGSGGTGGTGGVPKCINLTDFPQGVAAGDVDQSSVVLWARPGVAGTVRFEYGRDPDFVETLDGFDDVPVIDPAIPAKVELTGLLDGTQYYYRACLDTCPFSVARGCEAPASFRTPHTNGHHGLRFGVSSCFRGDMRPFVAIKNVPERDLDLFVALGDTVYADSHLSGPQGSSIHQFRAKHKLAYSQLKSQEDNIFAQARGSTAFFVDIDDHEVDNNFAGGAQPLSHIATGRREGRTLFCENPNTSEYDETNCSRDYINETDFFKNALQAVEEYNPIRQARYGQTGDPRTAGKPKLYRYRKFGKDAALFMLDMRSFRDKTDATLLRAYDSGRTMLGAAQLNELKSNLRDAEDNGITWKFVLVPEPIQHLDPITGPDRFEGYAYERAEILNFIQLECIGNVVFISGDIHGTIANNLAYKFSLLRRQRYSASWDISTGPVAYHVPFGRKIVDLLNEDLIPDIPGVPTVAEYDALPLALKDVGIRAFMDAILIARRVPPTGFYPEPPTGRLNPSSANIPATLLQESYVATNTFGWTEFEIDPTTQKLTVTTYGVLPYKQVAEDEDGPIPYTDEEVAGILAREPFIVSQFEVATGAPPPGCGCEPNIACVNDAACCPDNVCSTLVCVGRNSLPNVAPCSKDAACDSGVCNVLLCVAPNSLPNYAPCTRDAACRSNICGIVDVGPRLCGLPLLARCSTNAQCRNGNCSLLPFGLGELRCRVL